MAKYQYKLYKSDLSNMWFYKVYIDGTPHDHLDASFTRWGAGRRARAYIKRLINQKPGELYDYEG